MKTSSNNNNIESKNNQVFNSRKEQYEAIKYGRPWYLLLFYWGAHYAAYDKDAETVAEVLDGMDGVTTYEECGMKCTVFPVDALAEALPKLRARNEYISICDNLSHNGLYSRRTLADILNRNKTGRYYGECTDVFTSSDDREQADVKAEGCEVVRHIYYRIDCPDYEAGHDIDAFYSEVVKLLESEGWHVEGDWQGAHCPTMRKGAQSLYCHPQSLSGEVSPVECDRIGQVLMTGETFRLRGIDDYGRIFLTASEEQERDLYRQNYQDGLADVLREVLTTKRSNLYRDKGDALGNAYRRTAIENIRTDMEDKGSNYYYWRKAVTEFVDSEYDRLLQAGYIKEATGQNGRTLCRWINKKEEKELTKARREAEKAEKERKAQEWQEFLDREAEKQNSFAEGMRVKVPAASLERNRDKEAFVITRIRRKAADNGGNASLTVKSELTGVERDINGSDVSEILPALQKASEITASSEHGIKVGTEVWTTIELHEEYGKRGHVVRKYFADHGVWCLDIEFEDGTRKDYAEEYVTTEKPWAVVGAKCKHKYLNRDVVLTITAVGQYYGIKAESEDGKVKRCGLVRDFEPVEDVKEADFSDTLDDDLKAGDRVLSRHYGAQATVLGKEWDKQRKAWYYRVQFDTMQRHMDGSEFNVTEFHRDGLTKNYDPATGRERVGNAEYYRETLLAEFWGNNRTPRTVYGMEIFKPTDRRPSWLVVADIFSEPKEMTLREVCDMLAARYQEEQGKAA